MSAPKISATPIPWVVDQVNREYIATMCDGVYEYIGKIDPGDFSSVRRPYDECAANAAFIVRAVNCHDELVAALIGLSMRDRTPHIHASPEVLRARAAIAKATGEAP